MEDLDRQIQDTSLRAEALYQEVSPGVGYISRWEAVERFQDLLYLSMIGEHEPAAEGFFGLVTSGALAEEGLHRDAEWYLADSLFQLGNYHTAEARFQVVADDPKHPFRDDAVRRMLEIFALTNRLDSFRALYDLEIATGRVTATDLITYAIAKSLYVAGDYPGARTHFVKLQPGSPYYGKSLYFRGTLAILNRDLDGATPLFQEAADLSIVSTEDRKVHDLALLALGRIYYEKRDYPKAAEYYSRIAADSDFAAEKLYEISWTFIRTQAWQDALRGIDIFLLAYPDHEYAAQLKVIKGKLHLADVDYDDALKSFEQVIVDYAPVRDRFAQLERAGASADRAYFQEVLAISRNESQQSLPAYAVSMIKADPDLSRAISVFSELESEEQDISKSETLVRELKLALASGARISGFERIRFQALNVGWTGMGQMLDVLELEEAWQRQDAADARLTTLDALAQRRIALAQRASDLAGESAKERARIEESEMQVKRLHREALAIREEAADYARQIDALKRSLGTDTSTGGQERRAMLDDLARLQTEMDTAMREAEQLEARLAQMSIAPNQPSAHAALTEGELKLLEELDQLRLDFGRNRAAQGSELSKQLDSLYVSLTRAQERLQGVQNGVEKVERTELARIAERFQEEAQDVVRQRADHAELAIEAERVSGALTRQGFGRLEDFFARSLLDADLGAVDVYWAEKVAVSDEIESVKNERTELLGDLERQFGLIKQKVGNAP